MTRLDISYIHNTQAASRNLVDLFSYTLSEMSTIAIENFDVSALEFNFSKSADNKKRVFVNKRPGCRERIRLQLCESHPDKMVRAPFGISEPMQGAVVDSSRQSIEVSVNCPKLIAKMKEIDERVMQYLHDDSKKCFGKQLERSTIEDRYMYDTDG